MSSWNKATKSLRRTHKERSQPKERQRLGLLEKHKDYKLRADDYKFKQKRLKALREKAAFRNPDEFYFKMVSTHTEDGVHKATRKGKKHSAEALATMRTQDVAYLTAARQTELNKVERLQAALHLLDEKPKNKHTVFVDSEQEAAEFSPEKYFNTLPELVDRSFNRPTKEQLEKEELVISANKGEAHSKKLSKEKKRQYKELEQRLLRIEAIDQLIAEVQLQRNLMGKGKRKRVSEENKEEGKPAVYKWKRERKK
ncbi:UTP11-like, U3 small nucleolar ribonucleoprotein [Balamuthia mandrillaris]